MVQQPQRRTNPPAYDHATSAKLENILNALDYRGPRSRRQFSCRCPAHDDRHPSLSVRVMDDGRILIHCFAGCDKTEILHALGLTWRDLRPSRESRAITLQPGRAKAKAAKAAAPHTKHKPLGKVVAEYEYQDERGLPVCQVIRYEPKNFRQRSLSVEGEWVWSMKGVHPPLYRLPELLAASVNEWVFVVEGEKDVEALRQIGLVATCNIQGAGKWRAEYHRWLTNRRVCLLPDNDEPGRYHAQSVTHHLNCVARQVVILELPDLPLKGDVSDWLAQGGDAATLMALLSNTTCQLVFDYPDDGTLIRRPNRWSLLRWKYPSTQSPSPQDPAS